MKNKKAIKAFKKIEELFKERIIINLMEFNNEDTWKVLYEMWHRGIKEVVYNDQRYSIYFHGYISEDTSTPRIEINKLSNNEIINL